MADRISFRPNRHSNPISQTKKQKHNGKFRFIRQKRQGTNELLRQLS